MSPEVLEKLKKEGIDPDNFTLKQLWPEVLDKDGSRLVSDVCRRNGHNGDIWHARKYLIEKYPQSREEAKMLSQVWDEEPDEPYQINVAKAKVGSKEQGISGNQC